MTHPLPRSFAPALALAMAALVAGDRAAIAQQPSTSGSVEIPLATYTELMQQGTGGGVVGHALGNATIRVAVSEHSTGATARVQLSLRVHVLRDGLQRVPLLPAGTAIEQATIDGADVQLVVDRSGLSWTADRKGSYAASFTYTVDATSSGTGQAVRVPMPPVASSQLQATVPGPAADASLMPAAGLQATNVGSRAQLQATVPATSAVTIAWRGSQNRGHALSRAVYRGQLVRQAIQWDVDFAVEIFGSQTETVDLLPTTVALRDVVVDGRKASILRNGQSFATLVSGKGKHTIRASFLVPVSSNSGPPEAVLSIKKTPVSRFELTLPGDKEVVTVPAADVSHTRARGKTVADVFLAMTTAVRFTWSEAIPEAAVSELRASGSIYHTAHAEEGVLHASATVVYDVSSGQTHAIELQLPDDVQVNDVGDESGAILDWRVKTKKGESGTLTLFLNRQITGEFRFQVDYERLLGGTADAAAGFQVPLLWLANAHRQRGMLALLASRELTLEPVDEAGVTRVGGNQVPKFVRERLDKTIAHAFKYVSERPSLEVKAIQPERKQGRFDAQVDTLISLGEATMKGVARVEFTVKSGGIMQLELVLPSSVNFLNLTAPSLRGYKLEQAGEHQVIKVEFTQDMEGQFPVEVSYERIMKEGQTSVEVPTLSVRQAEVEQGRIAVEALAAMEVKPEITEHLSSLELAQLPQHLLLQTTNPILLAYRYAYAEPAHRLSLSLTQHRAIVTKAAVIDEAHYQTLITREGLAVTRARFTMRNTREQFLKVQLPGSSEVWKAFVGGVEEKPALVAATESRGDGPEVLIKILNSVKPFPVELVYMTPVSEMGMLGHVASELPQPDLIVTQSHWDIYLPDGLRYRRLDSNLDSVGEPTQVDREIMNAGLIGDGVDGREPLHISVPAAGVLYRFEKLYANQSGRRARFEIAYVSATGALVEQLLAALSVLLLLLGGGYLWVTRRRPVWIGRKRRVRLAAIAGVALGIVGLIATIGYLGTPPRASLTIAGLASLAWVTRLAWLRRSALWQLPTAVLTRTRKPAPAPAAAPMQVPMQTPMQTPAPAHGQAPLHGQDSGHTADSVPGQDPTSMTPPANAPVASASASASDSDAKPGAPMPAPATDAAAAPGTGEADES